MTEKNNQAAEIVEKDLVAAASDTESVNDFESAEGRMLITEQEDAKGESAPTSTAADGRGEKTPIIFLDDVHVIFKTRTGSILHPNKVHAVNGLTRSLARELAKDNIRVNAVAPGVTRTDMVAALPQELVDRISAGIPLGRVGEPLDIANAYLYLSSDLASYVTGVTLRVDGAAMT